MTALMLEFPIEAMALPDGSRQILGNQANPMPAASRVGEPITALDHDKLSAEFAAINVARAAHSPVDDLGLIDASVQPMRAVGWMRSNSFADSDRSCSVFSLFAA